MSGSPTRAALLLVAGWAALVLANGGMDFGRDPERFRGPTAAMLAAIVLIPVAAATLVRGSLRGLLSTWPARLVVGGAVASVAWTALSLAWASGPDLAWIEVNRAVLGVAALLVGVAFGRPGRGAWSGPAAAAPLLSAGCAVPVLWTLATKVFPDAPGADDLARLHGPLSLPNVTALIAVVAVPGILAVGVVGRRGSPPWTAAAAAAASATLTTVWLTYSRSGLLALAAALAIVLWLGHERRRTGALVVAASLGAAPAVIFGLRAHALTTDGMPPGDRRAAGLALGALVVGGALVAAAVARWAVPRAGRISRVVAKRIALTATLLGAAGLVAAVASAVTAGDRAIGDGSGRIVNASFNNRLHWWGEAARGFANAPLVGNGAGSFPLTHLRERVGSDVSSVRQPHQLTLQIASELGAVGLILSGVFIAGLAWACVRAARTRGRGDVAATVAVLGAIAVHAELDVSWSVPAVLVAGMALAGTLVGAGIGPADGRRPGAASAALAPAVCVVLVASAVVPWAALFALNRASNALSSRDIATARSAASAAATLNPFDIRAVVRRANIANVVGDPAGRVDAAREATRRQPDNPIGWACLSNAPVTPRERARALARLHDLSPHGGDRLRGLARC